jgi:hypothetical protein
MVARSRLILVSVDIVCTNKPVEVDDSEHRRCLQVQAAYISTRHLRQREEDKGS